MNRVHSCLLYRVILPLTLFTLLACNFLQGSATPTPTLPAPAPQDSTEAALAVEATQEQTESEEPDSLDYLLGLRSVQFRLTALYPDKTSRSIQAEVDSTGNIHLRISIPTGTPLEMPEDFDAPALPTDFEIYMVNGMSYQFNNQDHLWSADPTPIDYGIDLSDQLHGPDGPGLWLDILPEGSLQSSGQETVGGFTTDKYNVNGTVAEQTITGSLWIDQESQALVQVELHVPAALLVLESTTGELMVTLETQKAEIPPMTVPSPLAPTSTAP